MLIQINIKKKIYVNILQEQNNAAKISSQHQTIKPQGQEKLTIETLNRVFAILSDIILNNNHSRFNFSIMLFITVPHVPGKEEL